jgi:hypothetical protein
MGHDCPAQRYYRRIEREQNIGGAVVRFGTKNVFTAHLNALSPLKVHLGTTLPRNANPYQIAQGS